MIDKSLFNRIQLFKSVFKGREDVFAVRWEKGTKSGYMPAYFFDPYMYQAHKIKGGTFQNYKDKAPDFDNASPDPILSPLKLNIPKK